MGDLFGSWVPDEWIDEVFQACFNADRHRYMFLTKNPKRYDKAIDYTAGEDRGTEEIEIWDNMWFGTTDMPGRHGESKPLRNILRRP
jgi:protein gp37